MTDDAELLRRYAGTCDEAAFAELVRRHLGLVYHAALRQCGGDVHRAEDVAQAVFTDLARKARKLAHHTVLTGWLYTSTRYAAAQAVRTEARRQAREGEARVMSEIWPDNRSEFGAEWEKLRPQIDDALHSLGERDREAVLLRFFEGRPFAEVGAKLSLSEDAARMRVERALEKLRATLVRRGITSTTAALSVVLANHATAAVPAGVAVSVTGAALAAAAAGGSVALTGGVLAFMGTTKAIIGASGAAVIVATGAAVYHYDRMREAEALLADGNRERATLAARIVATEERALRAEKRALDADKDSEELLKAVESSRAQRAAAVASGRSSSVTSGTPSALPSTADELQNLAQMRAYQQALAKQRAVEAKSRAEFEMAIRLLDPVEKFHRRIEAVEHYVTNAEFQAGIRLLNEAMREKPADLPVSDRVAQLRVTLQAQAAPVDVTFISDGATFVSVSGQRAPVRFDRTVLGIPPGDYEVIGRRTGFRDVVLPLQVRGGVSAPLVQVVCTQTAQ